jgi:hypothetical protein
VPGSVQGGENAPLGWYSHRGTSEPALGQAAERTLLPPSTAEPQGLVQHWSHNGHTARHCHFTWPEVGRDSELI